MYKQLILLFLIAVTMSQLCPQKVVDACRADAQHGTNGPT